MKKIKYFRGLGLLILLVAVLAGCGGGGGGGGNDDPTSSTISFSMPIIYYTTTSVSSTGYTIPSGKTVKFYTLANTNDPVSADSTVYSGTTTTSGGNLKFTLPDSLKGQPRFIFAVVILNGDYDLQGKSQSDIKTDVSNGKVLFGQVYESSTSNSTKSVTLTDGATINNIRFLGVSAGDPISIIQFTMPDVYYTSKEFGTHAVMPTGKTVKFYTLTEATYTSLQADENLTVTADQTFSGTTGGDLQFILPVALVGEDRYIWAVVILKGDFDLRGKTKSELLAAVSAKQVLFGKSTDTTPSDDDLLLLNITGGSTCHFTFIGM